MPSTPKSTQKNIQSSGKKKKVAQKDSKTPQIASPKPLVSHKYTKFNPEVLTIHDHFSKHIEEGENSLQYQCKTCKAKKMTYTIGYYDYLNKHLDTDQHKLAVGADKDEIPGALKALETFRTRIKKVRVVSKETLDTIRIEVTAFILKNELPFALAPKITQFMQSLLIKHGEKALEKTTISDRLASQITRQLLSQSYKDEILEDLEKYPFTLSCDVSSDKLGPAYLCTHVKYIKNGEILTRMLSLDEIQDSSEGEVLFKIIHKIFEDQPKEVLTKNLVGISTDGGPNMCSPKDKGLTNRMKAEYPHFVIIKDFCHGFNNICKYALKKVPESPITLVEKFCSFRPILSPTSQIREIQKDFGEDELNEVYKILGYVDVRWSSLLNSINRVLLLWENLEVYFGQNPDININLLLDNKSHLYLQLCSCLLERLNSHIKHFENDNLDYTTIMPKLQETIILTARFVLDQDRVFGPKNDLLCEAILGLPLQNREELNPYLKSLELFKGSFLKKYGDFRNYLSGFSEKEAEDFFTVARDFLVEVLFQIKERLPCSDNLLKNCEAIKLQNFDRNKWETIALQFTNIVDKHNEAAFQNELDIFEFNFKELSAKLVQSGKTLVQFWPSQEESYPMITKLAVASLTLPYSSVSIERTFSILRDIREPKRNRLCTASVEGCLIVHHETKNNLIDITEASSESTAIFPEEEKTQVSSVKEADSTGLDDKDSKVMMNLFLQVLEKRSLKTL